MAQNVLELIRILVWPSVALAVLLVLKPHLTNLLSGAKVTLTVAGQSIETTFAEVKRAFEEQGGAPLSDTQIAFLSALREGPKNYPAGVADSAQRAFIRPMRNSGLIRTSPRNSYLGEAKVIELSALGRLFLEARDK